MLMSNGERCLEPVAATEADDSWRLSMSWRRLGAAAALSCVALGACSVSEGEESTYPQEHAAEMSYAAASRASVSTEVSENNEKLNAAIRYVAVGEMASDWDNSVVGGILGKLQASKKSRFANSGTKGDPVWTWQDGSLRASYGGDELKVSTSAVPENEPRRTVDVAARLIVNDPTDSMPAYNAGPKQWLSWLKQHTGDLSVTHLHAVETRKDSGQDRVDIRTWFEGNSTEKISGFDANGVNSYKPGGDANGKILAAIGEFYTRWQDAR